MGLRTFRLPDDLDTLLELIPPSFQYPENKAWSIQQDEVEGMVDSFRGVRRIWPVFRLLQWLAPPLRDALRGFIWEEDGRPVGMVNVLRSGTTDQWVIGNVAVLPDYRRRGIARQLVQASVDYARQRGAERIVLDVIADNVPARQLYESLGFVHFETRSELAFQPEQAVPQASEFPPEYVVERRSRLDWRARFSLAQRITPDDVRRFVPVEEGRFRQPAPVRVLGPIFGRAFGVRPLAFLVRRQDDGQVVATATAMIRRRPGGVNRLDVTFDPACDDLAAPLVATVVQAIRQAGPGRRIEWIVPDWQGALLEAALAAGFERRAEMHSMGIIV